MYNHPASCHQNIGEGSGFSLRNAKHQKAGGHFSGAWRTFPVLQVMSHEGDDKNFLNGKLIHPSNTFFNDNVDLQVHTQHLQQSLQIHCVAYGISDWNL